MKDCGPPPLMAVLMRLQADWTMSLSPLELNGRFKALAEGAGWIAAIGRANSVSPASKIFVRTNGQWTDVAEVSYPDISFQEIDIDYASGGSRNLFVASVYGRVFHYDVDAVAWQAIGPATTGPARGLWGDLYGLYLLYQSGSSVEMSRFDGVSWTHLQSPAFQGYSSVAGVSPDEVYAIAASRLYRVDGPVPIEASDVDCSATPVYQSLSAAEGQLVVEVSCAGQHQLWRRELGGWTLIATVPDPLPGYGSFRVSPSGQVYIGGGGGALFRVLPDHLESLEQSAGPPAMVLGGTSISSLFSGSDQGVAQFIDGGWQLLPGSPRYVQDLWQAPSGVLFATSVEAGLGQLWRYDGSQWSQLRTDIPTSDRPHVYGRSDSDFYYWLGRNIWRWDGAGWSDVPAMPCTGARSYVLKVTFAGSNIILAECYSGFGGNNRLLEFDGTSWATLMPLPQFDIDQAGPPESPVTYLIEWQGGTATYRVRSQSGWAPLSLPGGYAGVLTSVDGSRFISSNHESYATTDGTQPWSVVAEWVTRSTLFYRGALYGLWTDGRFAGSVRTFGGEPESGGPGQSIVLCDLGTQ